MGTKNDFFFVELCNLEDLFSSVLSQFKKYHPSGNLKFYNLGILKKLKIAYFSEKILPISLKLNFTPNTLGCKGLMHLGSMATLLFFLLFFKVFHWTYLCLIDTANEKGSTRALRRLVV